MGQTNARIVGQSLLLTAEIKSLPSMNQLMSYNLLALTGGAALALTPGLARVYYGAKFFGAVMDEGITEWYHFTVSMPYIYCTFIILSVAYFQALLYSHVFKEILERMRLGERLSVLMWPIEDMANSASLMSRDPYNRMAREHKVAMKRALDFQALRQQAEYCFANAQAWAKIRTPLLNSGKAKQEI